MADQDTLSQIAEEIGLALAPLGAALESPASFGALAAELGWDLAAIPPPISALAGLVSQIVDLLDAGDLDLSNVEKAISGIGGLVGAIRALSSDTASLPATADPAQFAAEFPGELIDFLLVDYLLTRRPVWGGILRALGVITLEPVPATGKRLAYTKRAIAWTDLARVLSDPSAVFRDAWGWGTAAFQQEPWLGAVLDLAEAMGLPARVEPLDPAVQAALSPGAPGTDPIHDWVLRMPLAGDPRGPVPVELGFGLYAPPASGAQPPGFAVMPYAEGTGAATIDITDTLQLVIAATIDLQGGAGLLVRPGGVDLLLGFIPGSGGGLQHGDQLSIGLASTASQPVLLLGSTAGSRLSIGDASITMGARLLAGNQLDIFGEPAIQGGELVIQPGGDADSFISNLLPSDGIKAGFNLGLGLSTHQGLYFTGSRYDLTIIDTKLRRVFTRFCRFTGSLFRLFVTGGAVSRSPLSALREAQTHPYSGAVAVGPETFAVALTSNNTLFHSDARAFSSQAAANDYVARSVATDPKLAGSLHVLPQFELAA